MRKVGFRWFQSATKSWDALFQEAAEFAAGIGRDRVISISHSEDGNQGVVTVWYWE